MLIQRTFFVNVTEDVLETIRASERAEAAYERKMYRYKAQYSLDCENGIENMEKICSNNIWTQKAIAVCSLIHSLSCAENSIFNIASQQHKKKRSLTK